MATINDINNQLDRIENAKEGIAEAIEEKGVDVPAGTRIGGYPALVRQIQQGSPDAVLFTPQELTSEQQAQARDNIGAGTYTKPGTGIPKTDLATGVQTSLGKADTALQPAALTPITELIPEQATPQNQLADKNFVNSSVATNTANYISDNGQPFQSVADLQAYTGPLTNNDYAFVVGTDSAGNTTYTRYKYNATTQTWAAEYVLNNSSFTAAQWAAISSGITALLVQKLSELPTEIVTYVAQTLTEAQKQQARTNIGATAPEIFWATYGTTTYQQVVDAHNAGKVVLVQQNEIVYILHRVANAACYFSSVVASTIYRVNVSSANSWSNSNATVQETSGRVTSWGSTPSDTNYPSEKLVKTSLNTLTASVAELQVHNLGEIDASDYDDDYEAWIKGELQQDGNYIFSYDGFTYYVHVETIYNEDSGITSIRQLVWGDEEGARSLFQYALIIEDGEIVHEETSYILDSAAASAMFAPLSHYHYTNANGAQSVWDYCNSNSFIWNNDGRIFYRDTLNSKAYIIERGFVNNAPYGRYQKVQPLDDATHYYQRVASRPGNSWIWGSWVQYNATPAIATTQPVGGFLPNIVYDLGLLTGSVTFALASPADVNIANPYHFTFETGNTVPNVSWPANIVWLDGSEPAINANNHYEILIRNGYGTALIFDISGNR